MAFTPAKPSINYVPFGLALIALLIGFWAFSQHRANSLDKNGVETIATISACKSCFNSFCYDYYFLVAGDTCYGGLRSSVRLADFMGGDCVGRQFKVTYDPTERQNNLLDLSQEER